MSFLFSLLWTFRVVLGTIQKGAWKGTWIPITVTSYMTSVTNLGDKLVSYIAHNHSTTSRQTTSPATSEIDCTGCPFSSAWSTRSVCWFSSVFTRRHQSTLQWWATRSASASRSHLRSAARGDLAVPRSRTTTYGQRSFFDSGPSLWNSLPLSVRDPSLTMTQFCTHLKTFLFRRAYCI